MTANIAFITSSHAAFDDRILYHQAVTLVEHGYTVTVVSAKEQLNTSFNTVAIRGFDGQVMSKTEKIELFCTILETLNPNLVICSEPLTVLAANRYRKNGHKTTIVLYDITEWYPSKKNLQPYHGMYKVLQGLRFSLFNVYTSSLAQGFIFGEYHKSIPYNLLFPFKPSAIISYFPNLKYIDFTEPTFHPYSLCLGYAGELSDDKGFFNFLNVVERINKLCPQLAISLKIIGWFPTENVRNVCKTFFAKLTCETIQIKDYLPFQTFIKELQTVDVFFDLRNIDFENNRGLPIKLFYYAATGRPVIYSKLKAITHAIAVSSFGYLVNPKDYDAIANQVIYYYKNPAQFQQHCIQARQAMETRYNWKQIEPAFVAFVERFIKIS